jgi:nicotinamide-nucleotide amidase
MRTPHRPIRTDTNRAHRRHLRIVNIRWLLPLLACVLQVSAAQGISLSRADHPPRYALVVTGGELLAGAYADGHTHFITRTLTPLGLQCLGSLCVPDSARDIQQALAFAAQQADLVIVTGGLGPTGNDLTREVLADFTGIALREHPQALAEMAQRFHVTTANLRPNLRRQVRVPTQGTYFKNRFGTAVGLVFEKPDQVVIALPGPPGELQPMVQEALVPYLNQRYGTHLPGCALTLRFVGLGQSQIDQVLSDHIQLPANISLSSQFHAGRVDFTFSLPTDTVQDRARLNTLKGDIMQHLGESIYTDGDTSLEDHVVQSLRAQGITLSLAEVGSGGHLSAALMQSAGISDVLIGAYVAPTTERLGALFNVPEDRWRTLSEDQKTAQLAQTAAQATGSRWSLAIGLPQVNPSGSRTVAVCTWIQGRVRCQALRYGGRSETAQARLTTQLLDGLRRQLKQPPVQAPQDPGVTH